MAKPDDRAFDAGLAEQKGKPEPALIEWWKARLAVLAAIPQDTARTGALMPVLRELASWPAAERQRVTKARVIAFAHLSPEQRQGLGAARQAAAALDRDLMTGDQKVVDELLPTLDPSVRAAYPQLR